MTFDELTTDPKQFFLKLYNNKKTRNYIALGILVFILLIVFIYRLTQWLDQPDPGATRVLICKKCEFREKKKISQLAEEKCPKCGSAMGYGWKCKDCDYEYPVTPSTKPSIQFTKQQLLNIQKTEFRCPNCGSTRTGPISK